LHKHRKVISMTSPLPVFSTAQALFDNTVNPAVINARATVNTAPPGAVQSGIDFAALGAADLDFLQVGGDVGQVFAQDFEAVISEALSAGILAAGIIGDIENVPVPVASVAAAMAATTAAASGGAAAPAAAAPTVSSVLAQVQQQASANATLLNTVFQDAKSAPVSDNLPAGNELQVLGGQILFQQNIDAVLNSFPSSLSSANESNAALIGTLQSLLTVEQTLNTTLSEIDTNDNYEQAISLTALNVALVLADAAILTNTSLAAAAYALFALEALAAQLVTVSVPGAYTVNIPSGAVSVDMVLSGAGGGGGGYNTAGSGTGGAGGATTATPTGGSTLTAAGGSGGASSESAAASAGGSPGNETFDGQTYTGGNGGAPGVNSAGYPGTAPGGGGGGGGAYGSVGGQGGSAGVWAAENVAITSAMTEIAGSVGAGGAGGSGTTTFTNGGVGGNGEAFFYFYS
jgi:hypothetical protein